MCKPISGIMKSDGTVFMPAKDAWNHSHTAIAALHGIPDGEWGDRYARFEVSPKGYKDESDWRLFRDQTKNTVLLVDDSWSFHLDENRMPAWFKDDEAALTDKCRMAAKRWLESFPEHLVPGARFTGGNHSTLAGGNHSTLTGGDYSTLAGGYCSTLTGGDGSTLTGGNHSTLTGGYCSTLTGGDYSTLTGGDGSTLAGGDRSTLTGGDRSTLTGGYRSTLAGGYRSTLILRHWDGKRVRSEVCYIGEDGFRPGVKYRWDDDKKQVVEATP